MAGRPRLNSCGPNDTTNDSSDTSVPSGSIGQRLNDSKEEPPSRVLPTVNIFRCTPVRNMILDTIVVRTRSRALDLHEHSRDACAFY